MKKMTLILLVTSYFLTACHEYPEPYSTEYYPQPIAYRVIATTLTNVDYAKINNNGTIVSTIYVNEQIQTAVWRPQSGRQIINMGVENVTNQATDINDNDMVVGVLEYFDQSREGFVWDAFNGVRFLSDMVPINSSEILPLGLNNQSQIVGSYNYDQAFTWDYLVDSTRLDFGQFYATDPVSNIQWSFDASAVIDVNDQGEAIAQCNGDSIACFWSYETGLLPVGNVFTRNGDMNYRYLSEINNYGYSVGSEQTSDSYIPFMWHKYEGVIYLEQLPFSYAYGEALAINDSNQVVGLAENSDGNIAAVLWENGRINDLNNDVDSPWFFDIAYDINDYGQIIVGAANDNRLFLLDPI